MAAKRKYAQITAEPGKFAKPFFATHEGGSHKMACCDCGLVHDMKFTAWMRATKNGQKGYMKLDGRSVLVLIQAKRNNRASAARRKSKAIKFIRANLSHDR